MKLKVFALQLIMLAFVVQGTSAQDCSKKPECAKKQSCCMQKCKNQKMCCGSSILNVASAEVTGLKTDKELLNMLTRDNITVREIKDSVPEYYNTWWKNFRKASGIKPYYVVSKNWDYMDSRVNFSHYTSELKYKVYTMGENYKQSIDSMKKIGEMLMNYTIAYKDQAVTFLSKYDMETKIYTVWVEETDFVYNPRSTDQIDDNTVLFSSVPVKKGKYIEIPVLSEEDALYLENNREKLRLLTVFQISDELSSKYIKSKYIDYIPVSLKARVILYDCTTNKIFYSKLFDQSKKKKAAKAPKAKKAEAKK